MFLRSCEVFGGTEVFGTTPVVTPNGFSLMSLRPSTGLLLLSGAASADGFIASSIGDEALVAGATEAAVSGAAGAGAADAEAGAVNGIAEVAAAAVTVVCGLGARVLMSTATTAAIVSTAAANPTHNPVRRLV